MAIFRFAQMIGVIALLFAVTPVLAEIIVNTVEVKGDLVYKKGPSEVYFTYPENCNGRLKCSDCTPRTYLSIYEADKDKWVTLNAPYHKVAKAARKAAQRICGKVKMVNFIPPKHKKSRFDTRTTPTIIAFVEANWDDLLAGRPIVSGATSYKLSGCRPARYTFETTEGTQKKTGREAAIFQLFDASGRSLGNMRVYYWPSTNRFKPFIDFFYGEPRSPCKIRRTAIN